MTAFIDGEPVRFSVMEDGQILASFDPWANWGIGSTVETALDDLVDSTREMRKLDRYEPWDNRAQEYGRQP